MKLTLTLEEVRQIVLRHYGIGPLLGATVEMEITSPPSCLGIADTFRREFLAQGLTNGCTNEVLPEKKISAIKLLRSMIPGCSLANAKFAAEQFPAFLKRAEKYGIPCMTSGTPAGW